MNRTEFEQLSAVRTDVITVHDLQDKSSRTLLYGYGTDNATWHVYLDGYGDIHVLSYWTSREPKMLLQAGVGPSGGCSQNEDYVPDKRLYPESCDAEFCALLMKAGVQLPFTAFDETAHAKRTARYVGFAGAGRDDLSGLEAVHLGKEALSPEVGSTLACALLQAAIAEGGHDSLRSVEGMGFWVRQDEAAAVRERALAMAGDARNASVSLPRTAAERYFRATELMETALGLAPSTALCLDMFGGVLQGEIHLPRALAQVDIDRAMRSHDVVPLKAGGLRIRTRKGAYGTADLVLVPYDSSSTSLLGTDRVFLFNRYFGDEGKFLERIQAYRQSLR